MSFFACEMRLIEINHIIDDLTIYNLRFIDDL